jgi:NADH-quinone oxidoreductase subunit A
MFGFWEMVVYLGFVAVGLIYILRKGVLDWAVQSAEKTDI